MKIINILGFFDRVLFYYRIYNIKMLRLYKLTLKHQIVYLKDVDKLVFDFIWLLI